MKTFKDVWEEAANSVGGGGVSMPPDAVHDKKKKKKDIYDGRTKAGRKFVERILARRKAAESKKEVKEDIAEAVSKYDFRYYRTNELELKNRAYGRDVEAAFKKAGYDVYGGDVSVRGTTIKFNRYSKHWGTDEKKLKAAIKKVLGIDVDRL